MITGFLQLLMEKQQLVRTTDNGDLPLMNLSAGDLLGHIPFINTGHEPHSASVYVSKDFNAREIDTEIIQKEYDQLSLTFKNMLENMGDCISATTMIVSEFHRRSLNIQIILFGVHPETKPGNKAWTHSSFQCGNRQF